MAFLGSIVLTIKQLSQPFLSCTSHEGLALFQGLSIQVWFCLLIIFSDIASFDVVESSESLIYCKSLNLQQALVYRQ